jgi:hypothetical protein
MAEGFATEKISGTNFYFISRGSCGSEVFRSLSKGEVQDNSLHNVPKEAEYLSYNWI